MTAAAPSVIALVGFMGAGKSAVGRLLAQQLGRVFLDADDEVERRAGRRIAAIFATDGEPAFRSLESATVVELLTDGATPMVLSLGGGALGAAATRAALREHAFVVHLHVGLDQALARVGGDPGRPMLARPDLPQLYAARLPVYREQADLELDTDGRSPRQVTQALLAALRPLDALARQAVTDPVAMERLLAEIRPRVLRLCGRFLPCRQDAEDACQDTLLAVSQGLAGWDGRAAFTSWLYRVAANRSRSTYDLLRRRSLETPGTPALTDLAPADPRTTSVVAGTRLDLLEGLARLSPEAAEAVALRDVLDLGYREIAELLEVPEGTVKSRLHDARRQLRQALT